MELQAVLNIMYIYSVHYCYLVLTAQVSSKKLTTSKFSLITICYAEGEMFVVLTWASVFIHIQLLVSRDPSYSEVQACGHGG